MIEEILFYSIKIPFKFGYDHAQANRMVSDSLIVGLKMDSGVEFFGECAPRSYVTGESLETVKSAIEQQKALLTSFEGDVDSIQRIVNAWGEKDLAALCAIENALIHSVLYNSSAHEHFAFAERELIYSATLTGGSRESFQKMAQLFALNGMRDVKMKLVDENDENLWRISFIKALYDGKVEIRVDGNEIWDFGTNAAQLEALVKAGISEFEQPFSKNDRTSCFQFRSAFGRDVQLILDDSITNQQTFDEHLENELMDGINIKISKNGGYYKSLKLAQKAQENKLTIQLGAHVGETSLLAYSGALFGFHPDLQFSHFEGAFSTHLLEIDPVSPPIQFGAKGILSKLPTHLTVTLNQEPIYRIKLT